MFENKCQELEKDNNIKEAQIKEAISKLKCLENDLISKESIIIQKDVVISKLNKDVDEMKRTLQQSHAKFRMLLAEEMKNFEAKLEDKEREIKILKDMIRSGQTQLKQREGELSRFKGVGQLSSVSARSPMSSKKDLKTEAFQLTENSSKSTL
jgi:chromosome segregation ATPase